MAERTIATVLKTVGFHDPGGSNPPPSADPNAAARAKAALPSHT